MSRRTKSFFEQTGSTKTKNYSWHNNYKREALSERPPNAPTPSLPPIPATSAAKSKLNAFHFQNQNSSHAERSNEQNEMVNTGADERTHDVDAGLKPMSSRTRASSPTTQQQTRSASDQTSNRKIALQHANTFPSTPADRLTFEELCGHVAEDRQVQDNDGPEEVLGWNPNSSCTAESPSHKRKRAQSSSPEFPSATSDRYTDPRPPRNVHQTPLVDPATELWRRLGGDNRHGPDSMKASGLGLALQASPRPLETPVKSSGFRRWASTGNEWPSSKSKRQRISAQADGSVWKGGPSKVAAMVEKMQASLAIQQANARSTTRSNARDPSSSSPLPEIVADVSPRRALLGTRPPGDAAAGHPHASPTRVFHSMSHSPSSRNARTGSKLSPLKPPAAISSDRAQRQDTTSRPQTATMSHAVQQEQISMTAPLISPKDFDEFDADLTLDDLAGETPHIKPPLRANPPATTKSRLGSKSKQSGQPTYQIGPPAPAFHADDFDDNMNIADDDDYGLDDMDEQGFFAAEMSATQALSSPNKYRSPHRQRPPSQRAQASISASIDKVSSPTPRKYRRLRVTRVSVIEHARSGSEVVLVCEAEDAHQVIAVTLRGSWRNTSIAVGNVVHITPSPAHRDILLEHTAPGQILLDDAETTPLLIVHPDHMLSATTVADAFDCVRKAVLQDRIKVTGETSKAMVYGKILHETFQQALLTNTWDEQRLHDLVRNTVATHLDALWELGMQNEVLAIEEIQAKMAEMSAWAQKFVRKTPSSAAKVNGTKDESLRIAVTGLVAIEEHVWSPMFGLKGNVDATVQLRESDNGKHRTVIAPFEVKTGRTTNATAHHAQTSMYTLLMSDRYDIPVRAGILYYLESSDTSKVHPSMHEIRQMVQQRNRVASYVHIARYPLLQQDDESILPSSQPMPQTGLPAMMKAPYKCGRCYAQQSCFTFHALCEQGTAESAGMIDDKKKDHSMVWTEALGHLLVLHSRDKNAESLRRQDMVKTWFSKWDRLLTFEEHENSRIRKELWTMPSHAREGVGRGFANLKIRQDFTAAQDMLSSTAIDGIEGSSGRIHRYVYAFERHDQFIGSALNEGTQLTAGEPVVVSSEGGQWALAIGYVISATANSITVAVDRKLGDARQQLSSFDEDNNQRYKGIMQLDAPAQSPGMLSKQNYRLDKDEFSNGLSRVRANLVRMMSSHPIHTRLRELIIFGASPIFSDAPMPQNLPPSQLGEMNSDQRAAANKVMSAEDYALVLGMPGTGKTTTIAHLIRTLLADGKSILLASYTHTAVDNILLKIRDIAPAGGILRFGMPAKINPAVREFCHLVSTSRSSIEEIDQVYMSTQIVATTCMGTSHALFTQRVFDVCIIDEASQITLPISISPLLCARKFVLVGDHYQLPPLVQNHAALAGGLDMSLFRMLCEQQPQAIAMLGKQYRMCKEIMSISNTLIYGGRLECGNAEVASRRLQLPSMHELKRLHPQSSTCGNKCWLQTACEPESKVIFVNTDSLGGAAREVLLTSSKNITNRLEGVLTAQLVLTLQTLGVASNDIGVITLYRSQIAFLRQLFSNASVPKDVELDSADRFQGRDKECIIISMVRSNAEGIVGDLIKDWRRLNVAFTRARSKLIVLGSRKTLAKNDLMARLMQLMDDNKWGLDLPANAETCHDSSLKITSPIAPDLTARHPNDDSPSLQCKKLSDRSPARPLRDSISAGNRGSDAGRGVKQPGKVIKGTQQSKPQLAKKRKEQQIVEIMEDLMAEDWS